MNYDLNKSDAPKKTSVARMVRELWPLISSERNIIIVAVAATLINVLLNLAAPRVMAYVIDVYVVAGDYAGVLRYGGVLLAMYVLTMVAAYSQTRLMGGVGQRVLNRLRAKVFAKLQSLPVAFFNQNKAGDLISRINNDTEKINQFFSQSLVQFFANLFLMAGSVGFLLALNVRLGAATLLPAVLLVFVTLALSGWVKRQNLRSSQTLGSMSSEIQESLTNFKVVIAFNRRDYFKKRFQEVNDANHNASVVAGIANHTFIPMYGLAANLGQLVVLAYGVALIAADQFTIGLLISFLAYANNFYTPMRQVAALWANLQAALASWDRVYEILSLQSNLSLVEDAPTSDAGKVLEFRGVAFTYPDGKQVLRDVNISLMAGKTYALVGPTGGGKTTTASLMARLYDPTGGTVFLKGRDIRGYSDEERTRRVGFILQEPSLFTGTVAENIAYGNEEFSGPDGATGLEAALRGAGMDKLLARFDGGLNAVLTAGGDSVSLGQKQLIAFMRAVLRKPDIMILDEATANIDTVTEQMLEAALAALPSTTTKVIIAHRLNTIENADEIFFVNGGEVIPAGSKDHAVEMLLEHHRRS